MVAASYDYSSVLYLNSKGHSFDGGDFCFIDEDGDSTLEPRIGRSAHPLRHQHPTSRLARNTLGLGWAVAEGCGWCGRCVIFPSGAEHLHQAQRVTEGARFVLASWYTLSPDHGEEIPQPTPEDEEDDAEEDDSGDEEGEGEAGLAQLQAMLDARIEALASDLRSHPGSQA